LQTRPLQVLLQRVGPAAPGLSLEAWPVRRLAGSLVRKRAPLLLARLTKSGLVRLAQIVLPLAGLLPSRLT
jgi:hypothetical protein